MDKVLLIKINMIEKYATSRKINNGIKLAKEAGYLFAETLDPTQVAKKAVNSLIEQLGFAGGGFYRYNKEKNTLDGIAYKLNLATYKNPPSLHGKLGLPFEKLIIPMDRANLLSKALYLEKEIVGGKLRNYLGRTVKPYLSDNIEKITATKQLLAIPTACGDHIESVMLVGKIDSEFTDEDIELLKILTNQIGFAMGNAVSHQQIIEQSKKANRKKKNLASIKFTIRIPKSMDKFLAWKIHNTKQSKAKFVRKFLEKKIENDEEFKKYNN